MRLEHETIHDNCPLLKETPPYSSTSFPIQPMQQGNQTRNKKDMCLVTFRTMLRIRPFLPEEKLNPCKACLLQTKTINFSSLKNWDQKKPLEEGDKIAALLQRPPSSSATGSSAPLTRRKKSKTHPHKETAQI